MQKILIGESALLFLQHENLWLESMSVVKLVRWRQKWWRVDGMFSFSVNNLQLTLLLTYNLVPGVSPHLYLESEIIFYSHGCKNLIIQTYSCITSILFYFPGMIKIYIIHLFPKKSPQKSPTEQFAKRQHAFIRVSEVLPWFIYKCQVHLGSFRLPHFIWICKERTTFEKPSISLHHKLCLYKTKRILWFFLFSKSQSVQTVCWSCNTESGSELTSSW